MRDPRRHLSQRDALRRDELRESPTSHPNRRDELHESPLWRLLPLRLLYLAFARQVRASWNSALRIAKRRIGLPAWLAAMTSSPPRFRKYHVAPRLGTDNVRRRILLRLRDQTTLAITKIPTT